MRKLKKQDRLRVIVNGVGLSLTVANIHDSTFCTQPHGNAVRECFRQLCEQETPRGLGGVFNEVQVQIDVL